MATATLPEDPTASANVHEDVTASSNLASTAVLAPEAPAGLAPDATEEDIRAKYGDLPLVMPGEAKPEEDKEDKKKSAAQQATLMLGTSPVAEVQGDDVTAVGAPAEQLQSLARQEDEVTEVRKEAPSISDAELDSLPIPDVPSSGLAPEPEPEPVTSPVAAAAGAAAGVAVAPMLGGAPGDPAPQPALGSTTPGAGGAPMPPPMPAPTIRDMDGSPHPDGLGAAGGAPGAPLLVDVTPLSLSVETVSGYCDNVIARNTPVPCEQTRAFVTARDNQTSVRVRVSQGESTRFDENTLLGELELSNLRPAPRGQVEISVTFALDTDGMLNVQATDVQTGRAQQARVRLVGLPDTTDVNAMASRHAAHPVV